MFNLTEVETKKNVQRDTLFDLKRNETKQRVTNKQYRFKKSFASAASSTQKPVGGA